MTFCDVIADNGYEPMLYASRGLFNYYLDAEKLEDKYTHLDRPVYDDLSATGYQGEYYIWQYSSNVRIPGIRCRFDGNYLYEKDYSVSTSRRRSSHQRGHGDLQTVGSASSLFCRSRAIQRQPKLR